MLTIILYLASLLYPDYMNSLPTKKYKAGLATFEMLIIILLASIPLFISFPYRVNIFLSWEGAYRISNGELPFRDFGTPLGGMYWVIPGIFFKLFGSQMITLVKAQVFINIISGLAFRSILKSCGVHPGIKFVSVLLYCISFSFFNFWPWYNHTVIVYEFIGLAFLLKAIAGEKNKYTVANLIAAAFFTACSFLTKQDAGGMAFMLSLALVFYTCLQNKKWLHLIIYAGAFAGILFLMIVPFIKSGFGYWFNHGQPPHSGRISAIEMINEFFGGSQMIKFYFFLILLLLILRFEKWKLLWQQKNEMLFLLLTLGILGEATVFQVTSYTPPDNNIFYHSFAIAFILTSLSKKMSLDFDKRKMITICSLGIMLWWSGVYWKYIQRFAERAFPPSRAVVSPTGENIVNRQTFMINTDTVDGSDAKWKASEWRSFKKILMPEATIEGISRFMNMDIVKQHKDLKVLNMSELTPLAAEVPFALEKGSEYPLWFHLGVGMFNKQAVMFEKKIADKDYDLVLFEYVPSLNNFYPFRVRDSLITHYQKIDSFPAPRRGDTRGVIEVYRKPQ